MREKNKLINYFLIISAIVFVYIVAIVSNIDKITDYNFLNEGASPSEEITRSALNYIYPALFIHIASCIFFIIKKTKPRKVMYPIATSIFIIIWHVFGVFKSGGSFIWMIFSTFFSSIGVIVMSIACGMKIDKKYEEKENIVGQ